MSSRWVARLEELCGYDISTNISFLLFDPPAERYGNDSKNHPIVSVKFPILKLSGLFPASMRVCLKLEIQQKLQKLWVLIRKASRLLEFCEICLWLRIRVF